MSGMGTERRMLLKDKWIEERKARVYPLYDWKTLQVIVIYVESDPEEKLKENIRKIKTEFADPTYQRDYENKYTLFFRTSGPTADGFISREGIRSDQGGIQSESRPLCLKYQRSHLSYGNRRYASLSIPVEQW